MCHGTIDSGLIKIQFQLDQNLVPASLKSQYTTYCRWGVDHASTIVVCSTQLSTQVPSLTSQKCDHAGIHVIMRLRAWDLVWSGKSQRPCSQQLRLHEFTSSEIGFRTWDPVWTNPWFETSLQVWAYWSWLYI